MNKNYTEVIINGKPYTLGGYEDSEYLQRVATYINTKVSELKKTEGYMRQSSDYRDMLLLLNLSDDYFKMRDRVSELEIQSEDLEKEIYNLRHELVSLKTKAEEADAKIAEAEKKLAQAEAKASQSTYSGSNYGQSNSSYNSGYSNNSYGNNNYSNRNEYRTGRKLP